MQGNGDGDEHDKHNDDDDEEEDMGETLVGGGVNALTCRAKREQIALNQHRYSPEEKIKTP